MGHEHIYGLLGDTIRARKSSRKMRLGSPSAPDGYKAGRKKRKWKHITEKACGNYLGESGERRGVRASAAQHSVIKSPRSHHQLSSVLGEKRMSQPLEALSPGASSLAETKSNK